jgi:N-acetylglucosamine-6-sulfatase
MMKAVDDSLGRMIEAIESAGQLDNTVIVLTSDHGYFYGEHGLNEERRLAYEETARIPLIVRYPAVARPDAERTQLVQIIDIVPTILEMTRVPDTVPRQGRSLVPLLQGADPVWRNSVLIEYYSDRVFPRILTMGYQAVRTERHKYIHYLELPGMDELYDLEADPFERNNLIGTEEGQRLLPGLQAELARLQQESGYRADFQGYR